MLPERSITVSNSVFLTASPCPTDAVPVTVSGACATVVPVAGEAIAISIPVPPGRLAVVVAPASATTLSAATATPRIAVRARPLVCLPILVPP